MDSDERDRVAEQFGVAPEQVERDHLISHLLAFLSQRLGGQLHFIGGTATARRPVRPIDQPLQTRFLIAGQPGVQRLTRHPKLRCHLRYL